MSEHDEYKNEKQESIKPLESLKSILTWVFRCIFDHLFLDSDDLQNPDEPGQFHKLVKSTNSGDPQHLVHALLKEKVERENCQ